LLKLITRLLVPARCILCNTEGLSLCENCLITLEKQPSVCYLCNAVTVDGRVCASCQWRTRVRRTTILWSYRKGVDKIVQAIKYEGSEDIAKRLALLLTQAGLPGFDLITFVPDTSKRRRERGYIAPQLIARELSRLTRKPYVELLTRTTHIPQVGASREVRWRQVKDNFLPRHPSLLEGKRILLIDDVITTGATVTECARIIKLAGSGPIFIAAIAKK
jgi:ComF family protein